jgi:hypothetical protein
MAALSLATDLGMGQPLEFALTGCMLATRPAESLGMPTSDLRDVYYFGLLRFIFDKLTLLQQLGAIPAPEHVGS